METRGPSSAGNRINPAVGGGGLQGTRGRAHPGDACRSSPPGGGECAVVAYGATSEKGRIFDPGSGAGATGAPFFIFPCRLQSGEEPGQAPARLPTTKRARFLPAPSSPRSLARGATRRRGHFLVSKDRVPRWHRGRRGARGGVPRPRAPVAGDATRASFRERHRIYRRWERRVRLAQNSLTTSESYIRPRGPRRVARPTAPPAAASTAGTAPGASFGWVALPRAPPPRGRDRPFRSSKWR